MQKGLMELVFILDKSGSMSGLEVDTIGGFNAMLDRQRTVEGACHITTALFDNGYKLLHDRIDIKAVRAMTPREYHADGSTALLDAIGMTIRKIINAQRHTADAYRAEKVMFVIMTDGEENASRVYSAETVRALIERQKEKYGWEFVFLGANIDAIQTAGRFGIDADRAVDYLADAEGTRLSYNAMAQAAAAFREKGSFDASCLMPVHADTKRRGWK